MKKSIIALAGLFAILGFFGASSANAAYTTIFSQLSASPDGIAVDSVGNFYISTSDHQIIKMDSNGNILNTWTSSHSSLGAIAVDRTGDIYVIAQADQELIKISSSGTLNDSFATLGNSPISLVTDNAGNAYVTSDDGYVEKITPSGVTSTYGVTDPNTYAIAIDGTGNIYTANVYPESVTKIATDGTSSVLKNWYSSHLGTNPQPLSIAVNSTGYVYVGCMDGTVIKISPTGNATVVATEPNGIVSLAIDSANNVYALDGSDNQVYEITPSGVSSLFGSTGNNPDQIVMAPSGDIYSADYADQTISRLSIHDTQPAFTIDPTRQSVVVGHPIIPDSIASTGGSTPSFSISPTLTDSGLSFDSTTGVLSGTPTVVGDTTYTISTTNTAGTASQTMELIVNPTAPNISLTSSNIVGVDGSPVVGYGIVNSGGASSSYSISPALPSGLSFDTTTGLISGTPTVVSANQTYTVTATNVTAQSSATFTLTVNPASPDISLSTTTITDAVSVATSTYTVTNSGGTALYSVSPTLPSGLSLNTTTGAITGTPTATSASTLYTLTATNVTSTSTATFTLIVNIAPPRITVTPSSETADVGTPIVGYSINNIGGAASHYSISPTPPSGLSFDSSTGLLSGTTVGTFSATPYTITATNISGSSSGTYTLNSILLPPFFTLSSPSESVTVNHPIVGYTLTSSGGPVASYSISPGAPAGLTFDTSTGLLSGTPTVPQVQTSYTIRGTNATSYSSATFKLTVLPNAPNISLSSSSETTPAGQPITGYTITNTGGAVTSYSISPSPSGGLSFNTSTGLLSGTTNHVGTQNLTITATNAGGTSTANYALTIGVALPVISLSSTSETTTAGHAITGYSINSTGGAVDSYAISPSPSTGLTFNTTNGLLSGSTSSIGTQHFTITATNASGTTTATYDLTVNIAAPAFTLSRSSETVVAGVAVGGYTINSTGGPIASYSISPSPSSGLSFNTTTGLLSGSTTSVGVQSFTIMATNTSGNTSRIYTLTVNPVAPSISLSRSSETVVTGHSISGYTITNTGGAIASYAISPPPSSGLTFNTSTGLLSGSTTHIGTQHFTITATNVTSTSTATYDLTVTIAAPSISLDSTSETVLAGDPISGYGINNGGGAVTSYAISPAPSSGLSFDTSSGLLSGSTTTLGTQHFTITATNGTGTSTATYDLTVNVALPIISLSQSSESVVSGQSIVGYTVSSTGGAVASYSISPTPTSGLSFNTSTGVLSGVTTTPGLQHFTITASNASGSTTATYDLTVAVAAPNISLSSSSESISLGSPISGYTILNNGGDVASYSISPTLPSGLSFDTTTGLLSGTPTSTGTTTFTITATNVTGNSNATYQLTVNAVVVSAPSISISSNTESIHIGSSITGYTLTNTGGPITRYTFGPIVPSGLNFDTTTGLLTGTPSSPQAARRFTVTAIGPGGTSAVHYTLTVIPDAPNVTISQSSEIVTEASSVVGYTITNTGGAVDSYSVSPTPLDDLYVDPTTGVFGGRTFTQGDQTYTITATNAGGSSSFTYTLHVIAIAPSITLTSTSETDQVGNPIQGYGISNTGDAVTSYSISPTLIDSGLTFNPNSGTISGTPTITESQTYTITATNSGGTSSASYTLNVTVAVPSISLSSNIETVTAGQTIVGYTVSVTPSPADYFQISPALTDPGLYFDNSTGLLTGNPSIPGDTIYSIYAINTAGSTFDTYELIVNPTAPSITITPTFEQVIVGQGLRAYAIGNTGGSVDSYSISPGITDPGLSFDQSTGLISGTPSVISDTTYTITATNVTGSSSANLELNVIPTAPHISLSPNTLPSIIIGQSLPAYTVNITGGPALSYSISPTLAAGLSFDTTTGLLTGTPTTLGTFTYSITATNLAGHTFANLHFTVNPEPPVITLSSTSETVIKNTAMTGYTISNTGGAITSYSISGGALPPGLSFNASTGVISGTPTVQLAATTFTITARNAGGSGTATFRLAVVNPQPLISLSLTSESAPYGSPIQEYSISNGGGRALSYSLSPAISNGLSFSTSTGLITGTPLADAPDVTYTITATNASGTSTATFDLTVVEPVPNISLSRTSETVFAGHAITGYTITNTGGVIASYSISPAVSNGLSFSTTTGLISGTPTTAAPDVTYTITAINATGTSTATYDLTVNIVAPNISLSHTSETATVGAPITGYTITNTGGPAANYTISPAIGNGLSFNTTTGIISGNPTAVASVVNYTITATNSSGISTATYAITVTAAAPHISLSSTSETVTMGQNVVGYTINNSGGAATSYTISPSVNLGGTFSFNTTTGLVSGFPAALGTFPYTITATNSSGSSSASYTLTVNDTVPVISLSSTSETLVSGQPLVGYTITSTGGGINSFSISPAVSTGLTFSTVTGLLSGHPRTVGTQQYTITATNGTGSGSATFNLTVLVAAPSLAISSPSETVVLGQAIVGYTFTNSGGAVASYSITPAIASGLSFNTSTGLLSGTPTAVGPLSYTITGTNSTGSSSMNYAISVNYPRPQISLSQTSETVQAGQTITGYTITNTGGPITSYSVLQTLAPGLSFDNSTGLISGSTLVPGVYNYTIKATNSSGNSSAIYILNVNLNAPSITLSNPIEQIQIGQAIAGYTISNAGGIITSYTISPSLPAGLTFNSSNGLIHGTPLSPQVQTAYRITATNASGSSFRNYKLTVLPLVPNITLSSTSETVVSGQNIVGYTITNSGGAADSYSISPSEMDNLNFDTTTGLLTGSTTTTGLQSYTITATNASGSSSAVYNLTVVEAAPSISLSRTTESATVGQAIAGYTISNSGGAAASYSISPAIGNGLSFDSTTGLISGSPNAPASPVTYTITATNSTGYSSATYTITVAVAAPTISLSRTTESVIAGHAISGYTITNSGGPISSYSISPSTSNGLTFNTTTGLIVGTPLVAASPVTYTITATNASGSATANYTITVSVSAPNISLSRSTESVVAGHAVSGYTITNTGGAVASYSISPAISNGLSFNTSTGLIFGTATTPAIAVTYTITGTNASGSSSASYTVTVTVAAPSISLSQTSESVTVGHAVTGYTISNTGGTVASYSISPAISNGLSFSTVTGLISGTPSAAAAVVAYTITATNATGTSTANYSLTVTSAPVVPQAPAITLSSTSESVVQGNQIVGYTISNSGGSAVSYSISPAANNGLTFNTATGLLSGAPTDGPTTKVFTITVTNTGGTSTAVFTLTITIPQNQQQSVAAPVIQISRTSESVVFGHAIAGYTIANTGGTVVSYSISPAVTNGLSFDTTSGLISGSPVAVANAVTYTITATNASGSSTATYTLTVTGLPPVVIALQQSIITGMSPVTGVPGVATQVVVTGTFPQQVTAIAINNANLPTGSWKQTLTNISFTIPARAAGKYTVQIYDNAAPVLAQQTFTFAVGSGSSSTGSTGDGGTKLTGTGTISITPKPKSVPHYIYEQCVNKKGSVRIAYGLNPVCPVGFVKK